MIAIAAVSKDGKIGHDDDMLWRLSEDFKWYKKNTLGNVVLVGRKTYEVLPLMALKGRQHIVITSKVVDIPDGVDIICCSSISEAMELVKKKEENGEKVYLGGGSQIYHSMIQYCNAAYITWVEREFPEANKDFPYMKVLDEFAIPDENPALEGEQNGLSFKTFKYLRLETLN